jgi:hypothetical protein
LTILNATPSWGTIQIDCKGLDARQVLLAILPHCLEAKQAGRRASLVVANLEYLEDSVTRLLKALDRLVADFDVEIALSDSSGFGSAFCQAMAGSARLELREDVA